MSKTSFPVAIVACCISFYVNPASAAPGSSIWLYPNDTIAKIQAIDSTSASNDTVPQADTGTLSGAGPYFNYNYIFTQGWAGIKIQWQEGMDLTTVFSDVGITFSLSDYDSLVFFYKGPLNTHTLTAWFVSTDGCGNYYYDSLGIFPSSSSWTWASVALSAAVKSRFAITQLNLIINNKAGTSLTSAPGNLKIDNIYLIKANPPSPVLVSPANNAVNQAVSSLGLSWGTVPNAISYGVQVSVNSNFSTTFFSQAELTTTLATVAALSYATTYYWEADAVTDSGSSGWSAPFSFTTAVANSSNSNCGCGAGSGAAMLPPLWFKLRAYRRRKAQREPGQKTEPV